jgi:hypothetical protein
MEEERRNYILFLERFEEPISWHENLLGAKKEAKRLDLKTFIVAKIIYEYGVTLTPEDKEDIDF